jgi:hypothetical protein
VSEVSLYSSNIRNMDFPRAMVFSWIIETSVGWIFPHRILAVATVLFPCSVGRVSFFLLSKLEGPDYRVIYVGVP